MADKSLKITPFHRSFEIRSNSFSADSLEFDMVFSTGAAVLRQPFFSEPYYEELSMDPAHVRLDRLKNKAPLLNSHTADNLDSVLGVIIGASVDGKVGTARAKLSGREDVKPIAEDIKNGILNHTSVGYRVYTFRDITQPGDQYQRLMAIDWEPFEISMVPIGADDGATLRADKIESNECKIINNNREEKIMGKEIEKTTADEINLDSVRAEATAAEKKRTLEIQTSCQRAGLDTEFANKLIADSVSIDKARAQIIDAIADKKEEGKNIISAHATLGADRDANSFRSGVENAILSRYKPDVYKVTDEGKKFRYMSLMDMSRFYVEMRDGQGSRGLSVDNVFQRAFHTSSDFAEILSNITGKTLRDGYLYAPATFESFVRRKEIKDFKENKRVALGEAPQLLKVNEAGEIKAGTIGESSESYYIYSYARDLLITRKVFINDDISAFTDVPFKFGLQTRNLESDLIYQQITLNPTMGDGVALFHATHANLLSASVIDEGALSAAKKTMRLQTGIDGVTQLNLSPKIILTPVALEDRAAQYVTIVQGSPLYASDASKINVHQGRYVVVSDPRLDTASATAWYMIGDINMADVIELGYLQGQESGPEVIVTEIPGEGIKIRALADRGAKILDHRNIVKNPGA